VSVLAPYFANALMVGAERMAKRLDAEWAGLEDEDALPSKNLERAIAGKAEPIETIQALADWAERESAIAATGGPDILAFLDECRAAARYLPEAL
jgi:hypothetical protein